MDDRRRDLIIAAQERNLKIAFVTAGGGAGLFELFKIRSCSRVLTEARMLYSHDSFTAFLGKPLNSPYVAQKTADIMARELGRKTEAPVCFALTCALSTDRERKGDNHGFLSICDSGKIVLQNHIQISGDSRAIQDSYVTETVLKYLLEFIAKQ